MTLNRVSWAIAAASIGFFIVILLFGAPSDPGNTVLIGSATMSASLVGAFLIARAPGNRIGPLLLLSGGLLAICAVLYGYALAGATQTPPWPGIGFVAAIVATLQFVPIAILLIAVPLVFPDGQLLSPRWRWLVGLIIGGLSASFLQNLLAPDQSGPAGIDGFVGLPALAPLAAYLDVIGSMISIVCFAGGAAAVWVRFRDGSPIERQQLKWLLALAALAAFFFPLSFLFDQLNPAFFFFGFLTVVALPVAIGIAITRYHLYDIDRIVSRTISYAVVTAILFGVFALVNLGLQAVLSGAVGDPPVVIAASTLAVAALFNPLRRRVQSIVDRRFHRSHYDAQSTVDDFAGRLRGQLDLPTLATELRQTTVEAVEPSATGIWLRGTGR
jgi:hypothetical protein